MTKLTLKDFEGWKGWDKFCARPNQFDKTKQNKQQLLQMAKNKEPKPHHKNHPLGKVLCYYTKPKSNNFDPVFTKKIKKLAPKWFEKTSDINKQKLLQMAKNGESRPHQTNHPLGRVLLCYTNPKNKCYDAEFTKKIRNLAPKWFKTVFDKAAEKKQKILQMAKNGKPRPITKKHPLGEALCRYTNPKNDCYDPVFTKKIKKLAPKWFEKSSDINKQKLLQMAKNKEPRPSQKNHPLGEALRSYTNPKKNSYDAVFTKKIRNLAPKWFVTIFDKAAEKKQKILQMAKNGKPRPITKKHPLGEALCRYTNPKNDCYDPVFTKKIKKLAPKWFEK